MPLLLPAQHHRQCSQAAVASRLNPWALSTAEYDFLKGRIDESHIKAYLQIRNAILRLWTRNPLVAVTREEAIETIKDRRLIAIAIAAHEWLARNGYINFGCVEIQQVKCGLIANSAPQRTVVIIGAGVSALSCARQMQSLFHQFADRWIKQRREQLPHIVLLEGRSRVGGRVYSHPLRDQQPGSLPHGLANVAELGAQIITGFESGNPLDAVIRGQLAMDYHLLRDNMLLYDHDGTLIDDDTDARMQDLFNDILELASEHPSSWKPAVKVPTNDGTRSTLAPAVLNGHSKDPREVAPPVKAAFTPTSTPTKAVPSPVPSPSKANMFPGLINHNGKRLRLDPTTSANSPSLGALMDELVTQEQGDRGLSARDLRVLNWHYANLEYGNAINVSQLSLGGWDQDSGNEFEGQHSMVLGGYNQLVRGLLTRPIPLDVRLSHKVSSIVYNSNSEDTSDSTTGHVRTAKVACTNGQTFDAHHIISTLPLGVMHANDVSFDPPLPPWKSSAISRMGFGVLNKLIMLFDAPFWPVDRDMFGLCNQPADAPDSRMQPDYARHRGRFYMFWNCIKSTGRPVMVALMAGDAANETEAHGSSGGSFGGSSSTTSPTASFAMHNGTANGNGNGARLSPSPSPEESDLIASCTRTLATMFHLSTPPTPREAIVTRWRSDPFARGSYSYLGPDAQPGDYDSIARPVGNLHFAGEATCGTHPATVHGAFLSGLRAAGEVVERMIGPVPPPGGGR